MDNRLRELIVKEANRMCCSAHGKGPEITFNSDDSFGVSCCCQPFKEFVEGKTKDILESAFEQYIKDSFTSKKIKL